MRLRIVRVSLPVIVVAAGVAVAWWMVESREREATAPPVVLAPPVRVAVVEPTRLELRVTTQGTVNPDTVTDLHAEVSGVVQRVSPSFETGGYFSAGEVLVRIDPRDFELAVVGARARLAQARLLLVREEAEAEAALAEWREIAPDRPAPPLAARVPQLDEARARVAAAEAELEVAERELARTELRAPYAGRIWRVAIDVGQFVDRGTELARVYAIDRAEVRLPIPVGDLAFVDLPIDHRGDDRERNDAAPRRSPRVELTASFAGRPHTWSARIVRTEGEIDPKSRMIHAIARVDDPYAPGPPGRPPLMVGMFVTASIAGHVLEDAVALPRAALRGGDRVLVVDGQDRVRIRAIEIARVERERVVVRAGLARGERVVTTPLDTVVDGMPVRVVAGDGLDDVAVPGDGR